MRLFLSLFTIFLFVGCSITPEVPSTVKKESQSKILANKTDAQQAKDEYKRLQAQRDTE